MTNKSLSARLFSSRHAHWLPLVVIAALCFLFFYFKLQRYLTLDMLRAYHLVLAQWTASHYLLAIIIYTMAFTLLIACTIPVGTLFSLLGGFLFGQIAILLAILSTTVGGMILYYAIRYSIGIKVNKKSNGWIKKFKQAFQENAFYYLLMLRLLPICPCWVSNISAGALNVSLKMFLAATVLGITPSIIIYVLAGRSLDKIFSTRDIPLVEIVSAPSIFFPLLGLAFLSLFPVIYKSVKKHRHKR